MPTRDPMDSTHAPNLAVIPAQIPNAVRWPYG